MKVECRLNSEAATLEGEPMDRLLDVLREGQGSMGPLTGTKEGCGEGECGACTVLMDGRPVLSCLVPLLQCEGRTIETVEAVAALAEGPARAFLESFVETGGVQCGACTPGIVVTAWALLQENPRPDRDQIQEALAGNLCRCTGYEGIFRAFKAFAQEAEAEG
jgi:aerobic-type carbon monoxide dehydrogenase small subunit (CoxS/CutS family)